MTAFPQIERCALGHQAQQTDYLTGHWPQMVARAPYFFIGAGKVHPWFALLEQP